MHLLTTADMERSFGVESAVITFAADGLENSGTTDKSDDQRG